MGNYWLDRRCRNKTGLQPVSRTCVEQPLLGFRIAEEKPDSLSTTLQQPSIYVKNMGLCLYIKDL